MDKAREEGTTKTGFLIDGYPREKDQGILFEEKVNNQSILLWKNLHYKNWQKCIQISLKCYVIFIILIISIGNLIPHVSAYMKKLSISLVLYRNLFLTFKRYKIFIWIHMHSYIIFSFSLPKTHLSYTCFSYLILSDFLIRIDIRD